jgi:hypothetical protein
MKDGEFYANPRLLGQAGYNNPANHKYILDPRKQQLGEQIGTANGSALDLRNKNESLALKQETLGDLNVERNDPSISEPHSKLTKLREETKNPDSGFDVRVFSTQGVRQAAMPNSAAGGQSQRVPLI